MDSEGKRTAGALADSPLRSGADGADRRPEPETAAITEHEDGRILRLKVPVPFSLRWVNAYLLAGDRGWTLVDPGLRSADTERFWRDSLLTLGIPWERIGTIAVTHHHPDHYGLAGWFQEMTGAPVHLSATARRYAQRLWGEEETFSASLLSAFSAHGLPDSLTGAMREHLRGVFGQVLPHPRDVRELPPVGQAFEMAGIRWELVGGEGHAPGHVSFHDPERGIVLCGDQVLPRITPNIGWMPDADPDPLGSYIDSLGRMAELGGAFAYPGHRDPFEDIGRRAMQLLDHHERRLAQMRETLADSGPAAAFETCEATFGTRLRENAHQLRFALAETIAHLERLVRSGMATRSGGRTDSGSGEIRYAAR